MLPLKTRLKEAYEDGSSDEQCFIQNLAIFYTSFFKNQSNLIENAEFSEYIQDGYNYLLMLSEVEEREVFKICLEYWNILVSDLYRLSLTSLSVGEFVETMNDSTRQYSTILSRVISNYFLDIFL